MKKKSLTTLALTSAVLFVILFYKKSLGINLFLFEAVLIPIMLYVNRPVKLNLLTGSVLFATGVSAIFTVIVNTSWGIFVNFLLLFCLGYVLAFPKGKSFFHAAWGTFLRCFSAQIAILQPNPKEKTPLNPNTSLKRKVHNFFFFVLIPVAILLFFFSLYVSSSSIFSKSVQPFLDEIAKIFTNLEFSLFFFFILGIIVVNPLLMNTKPLLIYNQDVASSDELKRTRTKRFLWFLTVALKTQNKTGIVLLSMLNVLILFFNYIDIANIWIGFEWNGAFLKEFVHEGTWLLLFSVFISAVIALYFFNSNLNFYSKNRLLKRLTVLWIAQNLIMTISVVIRNFYYINYFGLAYKRIAVLFVLVLVVVGLVTIIIKILKSKAATFYGTSTDFHY